MEMALLTRYARSMDLPLRMFSRSASQQLPLWIRQSGRGGLLVSHSDCLRQDNWGVPLCFRFVASAANSVSSISERPQYLTILCQRQQHLSSAKKKLLQNSGRAQGRRLFCEYNHFLPGQGNHCPEQGKPAPIETAKSKLENAVEAQDRTGILESLRLLKELLPGNQDCCNDNFKAADLLRTLVLPLRKDQLHKQGGGRDDDVVKESLEVALLLLDKASEAISIEELFEDVVQLTHILERIIGDYGGSAEHQVIKLANQILAKRRPSTPN